MAGQGVRAGLLADLPRKNCWTIAEHAGEASPHGMQHLLAGPFTSGCTGRPGVDATNTAPAPATTADKRPNSREDHKVRLEY